MQVDQNLLKRDGARHLDAEEDYGQLSPRQDWPRILNMNTQQLKGLEAEAGRDRHA